MRWRRKRAETVIQDDPGFRLASGQVAYARDEPLDIDRAMDDPWYGFGWCIAALLEVQASVVGEFETELTLTRDILKDVM